MNRRSFFQALTLKNMNIRPPYNNDESLFQKCKTCNMLCIKACEENIIFQNTDHTPFLKFDKSGCTFCTKCAAACDKNVLNININTNINSIPVINKDLCIAWTNNLCNSCTDACYPKSITFNSLFNPYINNETCNGCGFCESKCPLSAIKMEYKNK